jgi:hypothetical protein
MQPLLQALNEKLSLSTFSWIQPGDVINGAEHAIRSGGESATAWMILF